MEQLNYKPVPRFVSAYPKTVLTIAFVLFWLVGLVFFELGWPDHPDTRTAQIIFSLIEGAGWGWTLAAVNQRPALPVYPRRS